MNYAASSEYSRSSPTVEAQKTGAGPGAEGVRSWMENPKALRKHPRPLTVGLPTRQVVFLRQESLEQVIG